MHANDNQPQYLTPDELSTRWNGAISKRTMANWRSIGCGPRYVKLGGRVLYPVVEVERWEAARTVASTSQYVRTA